MQLFTIEQTRNFMGKKGRFVILNAVVHLSLAISAYAQVVAAQERGTTRVFVVDSVTGIPLAGVRLRIDRVAAEARTDTIGRAVVRPASESGWLYATKLGYKPQLIVLADPRSEIVIQLMRLPEALEQINVESDALPAWLLRNDRTRNLSDARRSGRLLLEEDIVRRNRFTLSDLLGTVPGLRTDGEFVYVPRAVGSSIQAPCQGVIVYLDGVSLGEVENVNRVAHPRDLAAVEVFLGAATLPRVYARPKAGCGVVALWTK